MIKNLSVNAGDIRDIGSIPRSVRCPGRVHSNPLQYPCLVNLMEEKPDELKSTGLQRVGHD